MESLTANETWYLLNAEFRAQALRQPELRAPTAAAEADFHDQLGDILTGMLAHLDMRLTVEPRSAVVTVVVLDGLSTVADSRHVLDVLPRLLSALITSTSSRRGTRNGCARRESDPAGWTCRRGRRRPRCSPASRRYPGSDDG